MPKRDSSGHSNNSVSLQIAEKGISTGIGAVKMCAVCSAGDPNTLKLDPDPGFWPNLDPVLDPGLYNQLWKKKFKIILEKNNFLLNKYILLNFKNQPVT